MSLQYIVFWSTHNRQIPEVCEETTVLEKLWMEGKTKEGTLGGDT